MTQYVINIGALPNDGTGDPLRTAFNDVNLNFNQVWATGLVNSNIGIANNTILTTNTNGNLILNPNGIGQVIANAHVIPDQNRIRNLGSSTRRWDTLYSQYVDIGGTLTVTGDISVNGNLSVTGNIIEVGNIITDAKTIQLANTAGTANAANGSGITVGANDNIATFLYNSADNSWTTNVGFETGNLILTDDRIMDLYGPSITNADLISGSTSGLDIVPNGDANATVLYNTYGNLLLQTSNTGSNVKTFTFDHTGNITLPTNISSINYANGQPYGIDTPAGTNTSIQFNNANVFGGTSNFTFDLSDGWMRVPGNISSLNTIGAHDFLSSGEFIGNVRSPGANGQVLYNRSGIIGASPYDFNFNEVTQTLYVTVGSFAGLANGTNALFVGAPGFTDLGSAVMAQFTGNVNDYSQINFQNISNSATASGDFIITSNNGDDTHNFINLGIASNNWDGSQTNSLGTDVGPNDGYLYVNSANLVIGTAIANGNVNTWKFDTTGNLTAGGNLIPKTSNVYSLGNATNQWSDLYVSNATIYMNNVPIGLTAGNVLTVDGNDVVTTNANGQTTLGNLSVDDNNIYNTNGQGVVISNFSFIAEAETAYVQIPAGNSPSDLSIVQEQGNVRIAAGGADWTFDTTGNLTAPGNITANIITATESADLGSLNFYASVISMNDDVWDNILISPNGESYAYLSVPKNSVANVQDVRLHNDAGNVEIGTNGGINTWLFDGTGNLNLASDGMLVGVTANNNGHINWVGNSSGDGFGYTTMNLVPDNTVNDSYLILDPTAPNHIHIRAGGVQDNSSSQLFLGGENSYFSVGSGLDPQLFVTSNGNTWVFNTDGNLQVPGNINGDNNAPLVIDGGSSGEGYISLPSSSFGGEQIGIVNKFSLGNGIRLETNGGNLFFGNDGNLTLPGNTFSVNYANGTQVSLGGNYSDSNVASFLAAFGSNNISTTGNITSGNFIGAGTNVDIVAGSYDWTFDNTGNLTLPGNSFTVNYANGTQVSLGGNYGNSNLANIGSNTISTTGNVSSGNLLVGGLISAAGNITGGNLITTGTFQSANIASSGNITSGNASNIILGNATSYLKQNASNSSINLNGSISLTPDTGASALNGVLIGGNGYLLAANGARVLTLVGNNSLTVAGNLSLGGSTGYSRLTTLGETATGANAIVAGQNPTILGNSSATFTANVNNYTQITFQNKSTGADATADYILTADNGNDTVNYSDFGIINSGYDNGTPTNSLGNIVFAADTYLYAQGNISNTSQSGGNLVIGTTVAGKTVKIFAGGNTASALVANISNTGISVAGNVTASNFIGNISITGNITGTSANVSLVAGSYTATFDNTGYLTLPAIGGDEGGELHLGIPAANTTLQDTVKIDVYQNRIRFFEGSANAKGAYIDLANCANSVSTAIGYRDIPQITFSANATAAVNAAGCHYYSTTAGNLALTLPDNSSVAFPTGATLTIVVNAAGNVLVNQAAGVSLYQAGSSTTGNRVVGAYGLATVMKVAANTWVISGTGVY